ncbi:MAG: hypothetical protein GWN46_23985 [Gammaproteobacteria bacterium]|nr:hypothetical protein [Gammaproteobacteria bacterium]
MSVETPPYLGVRGTGVATLHDDRGEEILRVLIERYLGETDSKLTRFLLARADRETAMAIEPLTLVSWDYQKRMGAAAAAARRSRSTHPDAEGLPAFGTRSGSGT